MIEPRSILLQWLPMPTRLTTRPQQHMRMQDENQLFNLCIKLRYCFWYVCHKPREVATPKM